MSEIKPDLGSHPAEAAEIARLLYNAAARRTRPAASNGMPRCAISSRRRPGIMPSSFPVGWSTRSDPMIGRPRPQFFAILSTL